MTIPRLNAMMTYWQKHPPVHLIVASLAGYKPNQEPIKSQENDFDEFLRTCNLMGGNIIRG